MFGLGIVQRFLIMRIDLDKLMTPINIIRVRFV